MGSVAAYYTNDAAFELPDIGLVDRTVTTLDVTRPGVRAHSLSIHRLPLPEGEDLAARVKANLDRASRKLRSHKVLFVRETEIAGRPAIETAAEWRGGMAMVYTRQAHLAVESRWLVFSANAPLDERETCDEVMERALSTFRLRS